MSLCNHRSNKIHRKLIGCVVAFVWFGLLVQPLAAQPADDPNQPMRQRRDELFDRAIELSEQGKLDESAELLRQVCSLEESAWGPANEELLGTLGTLAGVMALKQDGDAVVAIRQRMHRITDQLYGKSDYRTEDALRAIAHAQQNAARSPEDRVRLREARQTNEEVVKCYREGNYARAISLAKQATEVFREVLGEQHPDYAASVNNLAVLCFSTGDYQQAESLYREIIQVIRAGLGDQHPSYATSLNNLAALYRATGAFARAEPLDTQALQIRKSVLGDQHPDTANSLNNLALLYVKMGDYHRAEPLYVQALKILEDILGGQHPDYANALNNLASLYQSMGDYQGAELRFVEAMEIRRVTLGDKHPEFAASLSNLAGVYALLGKYADAERAYLQANEILKVVVGDQHPAYATSLNNLASLYQSVAQYIEAESLYTQSLEIRRAVLGERHSLYAQSLNNLAGLYESMGDYRRAEKLYLDALEVRKSVLGEHHAEYAASLNNLASIYEVIGDYQRAEPLYVQAMATWKAALGDQHPSYAISLNNLALLYKLMGEHSRAESLYIQALEIQKRALGEHHPNHARSLSNLAGLYESIGDYARAEPLAIEAVQTLEATLGDQHPAYAATLNNLAVLYLAMGEHSRAEPLFSQVMDRSVRQLDQTASIQTEQQQIAMSRSIRHRLDNAILCGLQLDPQPESIIHQSVAWKGSVLVRLRALRLAAADPAIAGSFRVLQSTTQRLSALIQAFPSAEKLAAWKEQVADLSQQKERLEARLMQDSEAFRAAQQKVSLDQVCRAIPEQAVVISYLEYGDIQAGRQLMATVLRRDRDPTMVQLGSAADALVAIERWRETLGADVAAEEAGLRLRRQLWEPLVPYLGDASLVFISTDSMLGQLPFAALPGKARQTYLIEDHAIAMLPVPLLLPNLMDRSPARWPQRADWRAALLMGDVQYDLEMPLVADRSPGEARQGSSYVALPATGREVDEIAGLFRTHAGSAEAELAVLRGKGATESAFRGLAEQVRWMHLATHGFFTTANQVRQTVPHNRLQPTSEISPGQLSGLVFAGANGRVKKMESGEWIDLLDDGILTADEIMYLNLENLELAVLSACETGLGETAGGEGILGLQRAFQIAGARTTVTSLWKVDDAATEVLMVEFYRNLVERKLGKLESLRQAQLWLLDNPDALAGRSLTTRGAVRPTKITNETKTEPARVSRSLPAYWAAFQLSGDPR